MENNMPLISIVMPAYNCENKISESIQSIISQTYDNWELIVIDDGSSDGTLNVIESYEKLNKKIKSYPNSQNIGVSNTRNRAIDLANGEWIAFLDSDDMWTKEKLEIQFKFSQVKSAEFLFTSASYINEKGIAYKGNFEVPESVSYKKLRNHNVISCSSVLIKKRFFDDIKMENDKIHEDYAVWLKILRTGVIAYGVNEPLLIYRLYKDSKSGNKLNTMKMTYKVFRFIGINQLGSAYFMSRHVLASIGKYRKIFSARESE